MTTLNIVEMPKPEPAPRNELMIAMLEELLAEAEAGKIIGLCIVKLDNENVASHINGGFQNFATIGALHFLATAITNDMLEHGD